ncbi:MAG: ATP-binding protein [Candidatus Nanohaloarchaea archaeon]|nr:ATP-binding protein [Candidatus Nanohaloarchaea archaeon]
MTVQSLRPEDPDRIAKLRNRIEAEWSITTDPRRGSELERRAEAVKQIEDRSVSGDNPVKFGVMIAAYGSDKDEASETIQKVKQVLRRHRISFREPIFRMHKAAKSVSVSHRNRPISAQTATSWSAAAAFQFASYDYFESGGIVFGSDDRSGDPVILDRFSWDAGHIARMGKIGSGKSYAAKLEILRSLDRYDDLQVIVIDPKQEYGDVTGVSDRVKRLTVEDRTQDNTGRLIGFVRRAYQAGHDHDGKTVVVLDEAHRVLNDDTGRQVLGELVREGRDQDIAVTLITQNADDFTRSQEGRNMLRQMDCYVFMRHQDVESSVEDFFNLSDRERIRLRKLRTGSKVGFSEAVIRGPVNTVLRIESLDTEKPVLEEEASSPGTDGEEG